MPVELVVPSVGESITEVEIGDWLKNPGEQIHQDEPVVVIETEKVTVELPAPASGTLTTMLKHKGDKATVGDVIGYMEPGGTGKTAGPSQKEPKSEKQPTELKSEEQPKVQQQAPPKIAPQVREEQVIPMTPIRRLIAERLVEA